MAAKKVSVQAFNPPFDSRMLSIGSPSSRGGGPLRRGWIVPDMVLFQGGLAGRVNFMYNPPQVTANHSLAPNSLTAEFAQSVQTPSQAWMTNVMGSTGEISFSLLFDRTYELWDKKYSGSLVGNYGAYVDVLAFYKYLNLVESNKTANPVGGADQFITGNNNRADLVNFNLFPSFPLTGYPVSYMYLGPNSLKYHGIIDSLNITYTHFSANMIPMRVEVDLTMQLYAPQPNGSGTGFSSNTGTGSVYGQGGSYAVPPNPAPKGPKQTKPGSPPKLPTGPGGH